MLQEVLAVIGRSEIRTDVASLRKRLDDESERQQEAIEAEREMLKALVDDDGPFVECLLSEAINKRLDIRARMRAEQLLRQWTDEAAPAGWSPATLRRYLSIRADMHHAEALEKLLQDDGRRREKLAKAREQIDFGYDALGRPMRPPLGWPMPSPMKADAPPRLVRGVAILEAENQHGEIFDYASSAPLFRKWSEHVSEVTAGKSRGVLRSMHGSRAAGKVVDMYFDPVRKAIEVTAEIVDDNEWRKVEASVYTAFSVAGRVEKWTRDGRQRFTMTPTEISLVDAPGVSGTEFTIVRPQ